MTVTAARLRSIEQSLGGIHRGIKRHKVSPHDPRTPDQLKKGGMQGGDRMAHHGYAETYARFFNHFARRDRLVIVELGILRGAGLALLGQVFPSARIIGLDVDLSHWHEACEQRLWRNLMARDCEVYEFDELADEDWLRLDNLLDGDDVDIFIDDALHTRDASLRALAKTRSLMAPEAAHFIEDTRSIADDVERLYAPTYAVEARGRLTVVHSIGELRPALWPVP